jgi:hypothetical protein
MTQRALALDAESARLALEGRASASAPVSTAASPATVRRTLTFLERAFVVLTFGLGWLWVRRRIA